MPSRTGNTYRVFTVGRVVGHYATIVAGRDADGCEDPRGGGPWWLFIDYRRRRKAKRVCAIGSNRAESRRIADLVAKTVELRLAEGDITPVVGKMPLAGVSAPTRSGASSHTALQRTWRPSLSRAARKAAASRQESPWRCDVRKLRVWTLVLMCYAIGALPGVAAGQGHSLMLHDGWALQSSAKISASGDAISRVGFSTAEWYRITVPNTVVGDRKSVV